MGACDHHTVRSPASALRGCPMHRMGNRLSPHESTHACRRVARQLKGDGRALVTTDTKTFRSRRAVNLTERMIVALRAHEEVQLDERQRRGKRWSDTCFIFTTSRGPPIETRNVYLDFGNVCDEAILGSLPWSFDTLRRASCSPRGQAAGCQSSPGSFARSQDL